MPLRRGRTFTDAERDPARPAPAVISESAAARLWPEQNPIGKRFSRGNRNEQGFEVVGVAADARVTSVEQSPPLMVYVPYWWRPRPAASLLVKTAVDPASVARAIRQVVRKVDPEIAVGQARVMTDIANSATAGRRYQAQLFVIFAMVALFIATLGVYAVTAYAVTKRRREMNIRVALGARTRAVLGLIVRQVGTAIGAGLALGLGGALAIGNAVSILLYEVHARDPMVLGGVVGIVGLAGFSAALLAVKRGLAIDPAAALRQE